MYLLWSTTFVERDAVIPIRLLHSDVLSSLWPLCPVMSSSSDDGLFSVQSLTDIVPAEEVAEHVQLQN